MNKGRPARRAVGSRELKARLGSYLQRVRAGETLTVTDRGEPIAELRPLEKTFDQKLQRLRATGRIGGGSGLMEPFEPTRIPGVSISDAVLEDREERF